MIISMDEKKNGTKFKSSIIRGTQPDKGIHTNIANATPSGSMESASP